MRTSTLRPEYPEKEFRDAGLLAAVARGEARLTPEQGLELARSMPLHDLGRWADARCRAVHGDALRTYIIDRNINGLKAMNTSSPTFRPVSHRVGATTSMVVPG